VVSEVPCIKSHGEVRRSDGFSKSSKEPICKKFVEVYKTSAGLSS